MVVTDPRLDRLVIRRHCSVIPVAITRSVKTDGSGESFIPSPSIIKEDKPAMAQLIRPAEGDGNSTSGKSDLLGPDCLLDLSPSVAES